MQRMIGPVLPVPLAGRGGLSRPDHPRPRRHYAAALRPPSRLIPVTDNYFGTKITDSLSLA